MLRVNDARRGIIELACRLERESDRFRQLDAALGDGDLGITVQLGCQAVQERLAEPGELASFAELFQAVGQAFAAANPSTMANLIRVAFRSAAKEAGPVDSMPSSRWCDVFETAIAGMQRRGGAKVGDKTIVDALVGSKLQLSKSLSATDGAPMPITTALRIGAEEGAATVVDSVSRVGRASWQRERTRGLPDPGAELWVAITRNLEQLAAPDDSRRRPSDSMSAT